ncbi:MAG TPA: Hpt domain-containing protein [Sphingomonas sp.]|nr:Hpt domain-containing protein [Sphingomonas sp.]
MSEHPTIDHAKLNGLRSELGVHFPRILSYFAEDGIKSVEAIEEAIRIRDAVALVRPAHTLKGESLQFGANALGYAAEHVEAVAREAVEARSFPADIVEYSTCLRPLFEEALRALQREAAPAVSPGPLRRTGGFGRKVG